MLKIRLSRVGKKKQPTYRVVIADARAARDGAFVEIVGHYNPRTNPTTFEVNEDKVRDWLAKGAQPTERVEKLLGKRGLVPEKDWGAASAAAAARREATARPPRPAAAEAPAPPPAPASPAAAAPVAAAEPEVAAEPTAAAEVEATAEAEAEPAAEAESEATAEAEAEAEPATEAKSETET